jgi:hypothetical protein
VDTFRKKLILVLNGDLTDEEYIPIQNFAAKYKNRENIVLATSLKQDFKEALFSLAVIEASGDSFSDFLFNQFKNYVALEGLNDSELTNEMDVITENLRLVNVHLKEG